MNWSIQHLQNHPISDFTSTLKRVEEATLVWLARKYLTMWVATMQCLCMLAYK